LGITLIKGGNVRIPNSIQLKSKQYKLYLFILGLRGVKSTGVVAIRKPYLNFDFDSLFLYNTEKTQGNPYSKNVKT